MAIRSPKEPVYYYERSGSDPRLVYFIPAGELERLATAGAIDPEAVKDFPDGVDLPCDEAAYAGFEEEYGYRPPVDPRAAQRAFYAMLTSTRDWEDLRGTGMVAGRVLDPRAARIDEELRDAELVTDEAGVPPAAESLEARRRRKTGKGERARRAQLALEDMAVEGVDPARSLREQGFASIEWEGDTPAMEFFTRLQQGKGD
jgi:hypothetical protein